MSQLNDRVYDTNVGKSGVSLDRVRKLFHESAQALVKPDSIFESGSGEDFYWFMSGIPFPYFNQVSVYTDKSEILEAAISPFYANKYVHAVFLGGAGLAHAEILKEKGYTNKGAVPLLAYSLDPKNDQHQLRDGLSLVRVQTQEELSICQSIMMDAFNMTPEITQSYTQPLLSDARAFRYYLLDHEVPVATALFIRSEKVLGCFDVATSPNQQRKGYGDYLMSSVFATHAQMGDELIVLQASKAGQPLYRRLGFQFLEHIQGWEIEDTTRMKRFTHHNLTLGEFNLRPGVDADAELMVPFLNDSEIAKWMGVPSPYTKADFERHLKRWRVGESAGKAMDWVIEKDGIPLGKISCHHTDWQVKRTEIGYLTFPPSRGMGMMSTVLRALVEFLFENYGFERIEVRTDVRNEGSRRTALKAGFTLEGILRRNYESDGEITDDAVFSMIKSDLAG